MAPDARSKLWYRCIMQSIVEEGFCALLLLPMVHVASATTTATGHTHVGQMYAYLVPIHRSLRQLCISYICSSLLTRILYRPGSCKM